MTYITWKERQTSDSLLEKTLSLKGEKYRKQGISANAMIYTSFSPWVSLKIQIHNIDFPYQRSQI